MEKKKLRERERERERERTFFVQEKYAQNRREWQIYSQRKRIRRV